MAMMNECCVRVVPLPVDVHGITVFDVDGFANIYINANDSRDVQQAALRHELKHLRKGDIDSRANIRVVEGD